jgi:hypothetical protein
MGILTLLILLAVLVTAVIVGPTAAFALIFFIVGMGMVWFLLTRMLLAVTTLEVAVIGSRPQQAFSRFLPAGRHWLRPYEYPVATIPLTGQSASGQSQGIQTSSGLPLTITWSVSYTLEPLRVQAHKREKAARILPGKSAATVRKHMGNILQHVVGELSIEALCQPGSYRRLERQARQQLATRLDELGFTFSRVMVGPIEMPAKVEAALAAAHKRRLQTELEAAALTRLHEAIRQFSDKDMDRLVELERIHALSQHGVTLVYDRPVSPPQWRVVNGRYSVAGER